MTDKTDEAIIELAAVALKSGVATEEMADKLLSFAIGLFIAEIGNDATAARLETEAKSARDRTENDIPPCVLPPLSFAETDAIDFFA